jgi:branched-chain amino acid transport system substrate-binding protein
MNVIYFSQLMVGAMTTLREQFQVKKVYVMNQDVLWARGTAKGMIERYFEPKGWEVVGHDEFPTGATDFGSSLRKARAAGAEIIFVAFDMPESGILVKQWKAFRVPAMLAGVISPLSGQAAWRTFDQSIGGLLVAITEVGNVPSAKHAAAKRFYDAYEKKYGTAIQSLHGPAPSYEAVYVLKEAIERANSTDPDAVVAALKQTDRQGVMGRVRFGPTNQVVYGTDPAEDAVGLFFQWTQDGRRVPVYPPSMAEGAIELPAWMKR